MVRIRFVSIPHGTIKSGVGASSDSFRFVSIPHGTIKREGTEHSPQGNMSFQFHMVRLKVE